MEKIKYTKCLPNEIGIFTYEAEGKKFFIAGVEANPVEFVAKIIEYAVSKERENNVEKAWLYIVKATEQGSWNKDELIKLINTK